MCQNVNIENKADTKFAYMYTYKYPTEKVPEGGGRSLDDRCASG